MQKNKQISFAVALLCAVGTHNALAGWGAWDDKTDLRGDEFKKVMSVANAADMAGLGPQSKDGHSTVNYQTISLFKVGEGAGRSYKVNTLDKLTRTPEAKNFYRYEMLPIESRLENGQIGDIHFNFPSNARRTVIFRNPETDRILAGNIPAAMMHSENESVAAAGPKLNLENGTPLAWEQAVAMGMEAMGASAYKSHPTQFNVSKLKDGTILLEFSDKGMEFQTKDGLVKVTAKGFSVVDPGYNVAFLTGLSYSGTLTSQDGKTTPVLGRKLIKAEGIGLSDFKGSELEARVLKDYDVLDSKVEQYAEDGKTPLSDLYAEIDPALGMWEGNSLAVAEHRTNIAPLVAYAVVASIDSTVTLAVNAYGLVTRNSNLASWNGPAASLVGYIAEHSTDNREVYMGKTIPEWAETATNVAMSISSLTGWVKGGGMAAVKGFDELAQSERFVESSLAAVSNKLLQNDGVRGFVHSLADLNGVRSDFQDYMTVITSREYDPIWASVYKSLNGEDIASTNMNDPQVRAYYQAALSAYLENNASKAAASPTTPSSGSLYDVGPIISDTALSIVPIIQGVTPINPNGYSFDGNPTGPATLMSAETLSFPSAATITASGVLSPLSTVTYTLNNGIYIGTNTSRTLWSRVEIAGSSVNPTNVDPTFGLHYANFGMLWMIGSANTEYSAVWGNGTSLTTLMPTTGSATFAGGFLGVQDGARVSGASSFAVNFQTAAITGSFNYTNGSLINGNGTVSGTVSGNKFTGTAAAGTMTGTSKGHFYGPGAQELSGILAVQNGTSALVGSYGAKR